MKQTEAVVLLALLWLAVAGCASATFFLNDTSLYPACLTDDDCKSYHRKRDHVCYQFFCYPWKSEAVDADTAASRPLKTCRKDKECGGAAAGDADVECFRHSDLRRVTNGLCLAPNRKCKAHEECVNKGGKCCNSYCCNQEYFDELKKLPCTADLGCQDLLLGRQCCVDLMGSTTSNKPNWEKICCDNEHGPFKKPPSDISQEDLDKLDKQIPRMQGLPPELLCQSMDYDMMIKLSSCKEFTTTTTTTTAKPVVTTKERSQGQGDISGTDSHVVAGAMIFSSLSALAISYMF